jgi:hypothetical protein
VNFCQKEKLKLKRSSFRGFQSPEVRENNNNNNNNNHHHG